MDAFEDAVRRGEQERARSQATPLAERLARVLAPCAFDPRTAAMVNMNPAQAEARARAGEMLAIIRELIREERGGFR